MTKKKIPVFKKPWDKLTPRQKQLRERSLDVLNKSRKSSQSLSRIAKDFGMSIKTVLNNTNGFNKKNKKWIPKKRDKINRIMLIHEKGQESSIEINDSRTASIIGRYHNAVKSFLVNGNLEPLQKFSKKKIKDIHKNQHSLETSPELIIEIKQRIENEPDRPEVYDS